MSSDAGNATDAPGFEDYVELTTDTGYIPVLVVLLAGLISQLVVLPILVVCGRRYEKRKKRRKKEAESKAQHVLAVRKRSFGAGTFCYEEEPDAAVTLTSERKVCDEEGGYEATELRKLTDANIFAMLFYHSTGNEDDILIPATEDSLSCHDCRKAAKTILKTSNVTAFLDRDVTLASTEKSMNLPMNSQQDNDDDSSASPKKCGCLGALSDSFNNLVNICKCDDGTKRILRLAVPFTFSGMVEEVLEIISLSIISLNLGTDVLSAYILVETLIEITSEFAGGAIDSQAPLVSHALGAGNNKLAGQYVQICTILYVVIQLLFVCFWSAFTYDIILLMGFDSTVAQMAQEYGRLAIWCDVIGGISEAYSDFFEVAGREIFIAVVGNAEAVAEFSALAIAILIFNGSLISVAIIEIVNTVLFFVFTVAYTFWKGWAQPFSTGMLGSCSVKNRFAVMQVIKTATPLAFGSVLIYGEVRSAHAQLTFVLRIKSILFSLQLTCLCVSPRLHSRISCCSNMI